MLNRNQLEIKNFLQERDIDELIHFTCVDNLESILSNGLLSLEDLYYNQIHYYYNDENRLEHKDNAICLSISFPNYKMFYKYRMKSNTEWCVIGLNSSILYEKNCLFCKTNAASYYETHRSDYEKRYLSGLKQLFDDDEYRNNVGLHKSFTTDPQAEVLVLDKIEPLYIDAVYFDKPSYNYRYFKNNFSGYNNCKFYVEHEAFVPRFDYSNW